jgi:DNA-binding CsgD family transcriptional regulator
LIRVVIIAESLLRARNLASLLAEDERLEIVDTRTSFRSNGQSQSGLPDVIVAVGFPLDQIPGDLPAVVGMGDDPLEEVPLGQAIRAWLPVNSSPAEVMAAIVAAANDLTVLTPAQARRWLRSTDVAHEDDRFGVEALTPRELQVLRMLADGIGNKEIAAQLGISDHTAKFHVAQILAKLHAASRTEAVRIGIRRGLVPI